MYEERDASEEKQGCLDDFIDCESTDEGREMTSSGHRSTPASKATRSTTDTNTDYVPDDTGDATDVEEEEVSTAEPEEVAAEFIIGPRDTPDNLPASFLLSVDYDGPRNKAIARLYRPDTKEVFFWFDNTGHQPYCYTDLSIQQVEAKIKRNPGFVKAESVQLKDLLRDRVITMTKVVGNNPLAIGGGTGAIRDLLTDPVSGANKAWEANIRYRNCYTYDRGIVAGMMYSIKDGVLTPAPPVIDQKTMDALMETVKAEKGLERIVQTYAPLFFAEVPHIKRLAVDIEVYSPQVNRIPDPNVAQNEVTAIGLSDNEGLNKCLVLKRKGVPWGEKSAGFPAELEVVAFDSEREMILEAFSIIDKYPVVITFVGDSFDFNYLYNRAKRLKIDIKTQCPIYLGKDVALLRRGVHVDLYRFLKNPSIRLYALSGAYEQTNLDSIAKGLLKVGKLKISSEISLIHLYELAHYCWQDASITLQITTYKNELLFRLIVLLMRISRLSMEDVTRQGISSWIQSLFRQEHRSRGCLIPRQVDIETFKASEAQTEATIKDKRFKGAIVIDPIAGVHFNATVLDFASLYPTIMKRHNISYETVDCPHEECKAATDNRVPETDHWTCKKNRGMISQTIGFFRDIRVDWFKAKSKDKSLDTKTRDWYSVVERALKVFVNASYGVTGAQHFELFCMPAAESVTAFGRDAIMKAKRKAESMGIRVLYGDTDSVFLDSPTPEQQSELVRWSAEELGIDLEVDKTYKYVALSERKKNYIGVYGSGQVEVKGLSGKKRNTPDFVQAAFKEMLQVLSRVDSIEGFETAKGQIRGIVNTVLDRLEGKREPYSPEELAYRVQMTKDLRSYGQSKPQHVRAAEMLEAKGFDIQAGTLIEYIKTKGDGVLPVQLARDTTYWIDKDKYLDTLRSVFEQVLDSVGIDFDELLGFTTLDQFF
ncbi:MAG: DNA-directed DNA polymerase I [Candidatus Thorarchaeota archaeon]|nr:DNA-directed DNA polymerase I [Candidatus Thorarchaeota archaeon]